MANAPSTGHHRDSAGAAPVAERRGKDRLPYRSAVGFVPVHPDGALGSPIPMVAADVSPGGLKVLSPESLAPGTAAVIQLVHEQGRIALLGAEVRHCRSVPGEAGSYEVGLAFGALPPGIDPGRFRDDAGRLMLIDARLRPPR